jgi:hypothetical protein
VPVSNLLQGNKKSLLNNPNKKGLMCGHKQLVRQQYLKPENQKIQLSLKFKVFFQLLKIKNPNINLSAKRS